MKTDQSAQIQWRVAICAISYAVQCIYTHYPLADDYLPGSDTNRHGLGLEALSVRCALHRKFGLLPVLRKRRHALLHFLIRPGAADDVKELQALVNVNFTHWPVSLMEMD